MLVLSRKIYEEICIGDNVRVMVIEIRGDEVTLGITAPRDVPVHRHEIAEAIQRESEATDSDCD
jgi:carbon storage regulator